MYVEFLTPLSLILQTNAKAITLPTKNGEIEILPGHKNIIIDLEKGQIKVLLHNNKTISLFTSGGFIEVVSGKCKIISENIENEGNLKIDYIQKSLENISLLIEKSTNKEPKYLEQLNLKYIFLKNLTENFKKDSK